MKVIYCANCGKRLSEGAIFCPFCGVRIDRSIEVVSDDSHEESQPTIESTPIVEQHSNTTIEECSSCISEPSSTCVEEPIIEQNVQDIENTPVTEAEPVEEKKEEGEPTSPGLCVISFMFPIVGFIMANSRNNRKYALWGSIGFGLGLISRLISI